MFSELNLYWCVIPLLLMGCGFMLYLLHDRWGFISRHEYTATLWLIGASALMIALSILFAANNADYYVCLYVALSAVYPLWSAAHSLYVQRRREKALDTTMSGSTWINGLGLAVVAITFRRLELMIDGTQSMTEAVLAITIFAIVDATVLVPCYVLYHQSLAKNNSFVREQNNAVA